MPARHDATARLDGSDGAAPPKLSFGQRVLLALAPGEARADRARRKEPIGDWMRRTFLKPEDPDAAPAKAPDTAAIGRGARRRWSRSTDDKERAIGLVGGSTGSSHRLPRHPRPRRERPAQHLANGAVNPHYVNPSLYDEVLLVLLVLSIRDAHHGVAAQAPLPRDRDCPLRIGHLQPSLLGIRDPVHHLRRLVPGACVPAAAGPAGGDR